MKRSQLFPVLAPALLAFVATACGRRALESDEVERNRIFAEILRREDHRTLGNDGLVERSLEDDAQPHVQQWCAIAAGRIGDPAALPWLCRAGRNSKAALRAAAAFAIGEIEDRELVSLEGRAPDPAAVAALESLLYDTALEARARAIEALGKIGTPEHVPMILRAVRDFRPEGDPRRRFLLEQAITSLLRLKAKEATGFLVRMAEETDPELQWRAEAALVRLRVTSVRDVFLRLLESPHPYVRACAARGLGICGDSAMAVRLEPMIGRVRPGSDERIPLPIRVCAVQALGDLRVPSSVRAIRRVLEDEPADEQHPDQANFSVQAAAAVAAIGTADAEPALVPLLRFRGAVANGAVIALARLLKDRPDRFFTLVSADRFSEPSGIRAWAQALGELGGELADRALRQILIRAAQEGPQAADTLAVPTVLSSLSRLNPQDLDMILKPFLASHDPVILRAAVAAYRPRTGDPDPSGPIVAAYRNIADTDDPETKVSVLNRLENWASDATVQNLLFGTLRDRTGNARIAAARLLRSAGATPAPWPRGTGEPRITEFTYMVLAGARRDRTVAIIETNRGSIEIALFREDAPLTVDNFCTLARRGFYDGLTFMRVVPFFVVQGGDPRNDMEGGPGYAIRCEINMRSFERGSIGMALAGKDTGGSQFFITLAPQPHLDGGYTCFGRVVAGMPIVDRIVPGDRILRIRIEEDTMVFNDRRY